MSTFRLTALGFAMGPFSPRGERRDVAPRGRSEQRAANTSLAFLRKVAASGSRLAALALIGAALAPTLARGAAAEEAKDPHEAVYAEDSYPSARVCKQCHQEIFQEWASSNHAYASISPMFHKFEQRINDLASGTVGTFCVRCHQQVGTQRGEKREQALWERSKVSSEGITCITCHRVTEAYGKVNGERRIVPGNINEPMVGGGGDQEQTVLKDPDYWKVDPVGTGRGAKIHAGVVPFEQINTAEFCVGCHQVAVHPGIKLEVVWEQYRDSPAHSAGVICQDCHMGTVPGRSSGYAMDYAAVVNGKPVGEKRKHHNHSFYGPGYPIAHPGIFPHNPDGDRWSYTDWLAFDYRAGWGTDEFEAREDDFEKASDDLDKALKAGNAADARKAASAFAKVVPVNADKSAQDALAQLQASPSAETLKALRKEMRMDFPDAWSSLDDRTDARKVVDANLEALEKKKKLRLAVMENGSRIDGPFFSSPPKVGEGLSFSYRVTNTDDGHNLPSGSLGAQPEIWLNVALIDPDGKRVFESGYVDSIGDMADLHSQDVLDGKVPHDGQLFNLQTKFLTTNVKGTEREMPLPVNVDIDQLPFIRQATVPTTVLNHPPFIRMEQRSLPPIGSRMAEYKSPPLTKPGKYRLAVRLRSRAEPIYFMRFVEATPEMEQAMNEWMIDIHPYTVEFDVK
jgi:Cytochrome c554 and c-prime